MIKCMILLNYANKLFNTFIQLLWCTKLLAPFLQQNCKQFKKCVELHWLRYISLDTFNL